MATFRVSLGFQLDGCNTILNLRWYRSTRILNSTAAVVTRIDRLSLQHIYHVVCFSKEDIHS
jgi:hypothetical protein